MRTDPEPVSLPSLAETLLWLCRIPSPTGEERALCEAIGERLGRVASAAPMRRYGDSLVVPLTRGNPTHILLAGHLDVVRTDHDAPPRIEGDRLYGPGAADMKSGLCLMLAIAEAQSHPEVDLTLVFYAGEEGPYANNQLGTVLGEDPEVRRADLAVLLEPSDNKLQLGCGGSIQATVRFSGRTAHSARPWQGENAIHKAGKLLLRLSELEPEVQVIEDLEWRNVLSATLARGGRARNVVPDLFELNLNYRFSPAVNVGRAKSRLEEFIGNEAELTFVDVSPPAPPFKSHPLVQGLIASGVKAIEPKQAWTDVGRLATLGLPAVNFGPGVQAQAHQQNEWTSVAQLAEGLGILRRWLEFSAQYGTGSIPRYGELLPSETRGTESPVGDSARFAQAIALFDRANAEDPHTELVDGTPQPHEQVQAERLSAWVTRLDPAASEALRLAARCQHIRRWTIPRSDFAPDRVGYQKWRVRLARFHADSASEILRSVGYDPDTIQAVRRINLKQGLGSDPDTQTMEDALCLAFLEFDLSAFSQKHSDDKVVEILRKTWKKMTPRGRTWAVKLKLPEPAHALVLRAIGPGV